MKSRTKILIAFIGVIFIFYGYMIVTLTFNQVFEPVQVGETWHRIYGNTDNPFEPVDTTFVKVLDIKDGYVKYQYSWSSSSTSTDLNLFTRMYDKFKP